MSFAATSPNSGTTMVVSVTDFLLKTEVELTAGVAVAKMFSVEETGASFSALGVGVEKLNEGFDSVFSGFGSPNEKLPGKAVVVVVVLAALAPKAIPLLSPNLKLLPEF